MREKPSYGYGDRRVLPVEYRTYDEIYNNNTIPIGILCVYQVFYVEILVEYLKYIPVFYRR